MQSHGQTNGVRLDPNSPNRVHPASSAPTDRGKAAMTSRKIFNAMLLVGSVMPLLSAIFVGGWIQPILEARVGGPASMILGSVIAFAVLVAGGIMISVLFIASGPHPDKSVSTARLDNVRLDIPEMVIPG